MSTVEWINTVWSTHTVESNPTVKWKGVLTHTIWMKPEDTM